MSTEVLVWLALAAVVLCVVDELLVFFVRLLDRWAMGPAILLACALLAGCGSPATVVAGDRRGRALRAWLTVEHVAGEEPIAVDGVRVRVAGRLRGSPEDLLVLVPLEADGLDLGDELEPGDSGSPVVDARGRVVGLVVGRRAGAPVLRRWP